MDTAADLPLFLPDTEDCRLAALQFGKLEPTHAPSHLRFDLP